MTPAEIIPDVLKSETKLTEMAKLHNPKVENGKSDFHLAWRLCYEWMRDQIKQDYDQR